jgi:hypothetical protein
MVARHGDLCCFALTSDGGALAVTIVQGDVRHKAYASDPDRLLQVLHTLLDEVL